MFFLMHDIVNLAWTVYKTLPFQTKSLEEGVETIKSTPALFGLMKSYTTAPQ